MYKAVIFDFDGVILESVSVKTDAFRTMFSWSENHVDEIVRFHVENGGMSRYDKFRHIYKTILQQPLPDEEFSQLSERFSNLVEKAVTIAPFVEGTEKMLNTYYKKIPLYIVSATPEDELNRIVHARGIHHYFQGIFGSPKKKSDHIQRIIKEKAMDPKEVLFVGDAINDLSAARECNIRFIGRIRPSDRNVFLNQPGVESVISNLLDLSGYLEGKV